jgi:hypothetical protein
VKSPRVMGPFDASSRSSKQSCRTEDQSDTQKTKNGSWSRALGFMLSLWRWGSEPRKYLEVAKLGSRQPVLEWHRHFNVSGRCLTTAVGARTRFFFLCVREEGPASTACRSPSAGQPSLWPSSSSPASRVSSSCGCLSLSRSAAAVTNTACCRRCCCLQPGSSPVGLWLA